MEKEIDLSIITVGMNHLPYIKTLFYSLYDVAKPHINFEMIYVDNCSVDGSVAFVKKKYPMVKVIENEKPFGFGHNNNIGFRHSLGRIIAIINPDIVLLPKSIDILFEYINKSCSVGIVVPELLNPDGTHQYSVRKFINFKTFFYRLFSGLSDDSENSKVKEYLCKNSSVTEARNIDWAIGAVFILRREMYEKLRGFDTDYFLYMEDEDLCLRTWKSGYSVYYLPSSKMIHNHMRASSHLGKKSFIHFKSLIMFFAKHGFNIAKYSN